MDYERYKYLKIEKIDKVALITLNNPVMNSINSEMHKEIEDVLLDIAKDEEMNVAVLTGAGKHFSVGGDVKEMKTSFVDHSFIPAIKMDTAYRIIANMLNLQKPIIAAVNGQAVGLGANLALLCDVVIASKNARFGDPHIKLGLVTGDSGALIWPLLIGPSRAKEYLMTGDFIQAKEAERIGLVNRVVTQDQLLPTAMALAQRLANGPIKAICWTKMSVNQVLRQRMNLVLPLSLATEYLSMHLGDFNEGVDAFINKRPPKFKGD